jgi:hypothetical protein
MGLVIVSAVSHTNVMSFDIKAEQSRGIFLGVSAARLFTDHRAHSVELLRRSQHRLDWANMPGPFRHYKGVSMLDLPADPPRPEALTLHVLQGFWCAPYLRRPLWRVISPSRNLHPGEVHFVTEWGCIITLPSSQMAEQRALGNPEMQSDGLRQSHLF